MKWFQVDSNAPDDPKIRAVLNRFGNAGMGMLFRLWCYIAQHGTQRPGASVDSHGRPFEKSALISATGGSEAEFDLLLSEMVRSGHVAEKPWKSKGVIYFPAMSKRADTYSQRRVRTRFKATSKLVRVQDSTVQDSTVQEQERRYSGAVAPRKPTRKNGHDKDPYPVVLKIASDLLGRIPVRKTVELASLKEDVKRRCASLHIPYEGDVVGRAVESALAVRTKVAGASR